MNFILIVLYMEFYLIIIFVSNVIKIIITITTF